MPALTRHDLQPFIDAHGLNATILPLSQPTATVEEAARALDVHADQIIKSLVFVMDAAPLVVINNGLARVDRKKLGAALGVGRRKVKFADPDQALAITGFAVGSMPPFGHRQPLRTLVDRRVLLLKEVFAGGGDGETMMRLLPTELVDVTGAEVVDIAAPAPVPFTQVKASGPLTA
jgi:prolyl-tRNA editing enzyme YbaK/EbsC (Cys-tRNA(Pro) deacylase)